MKVDLERLRRVCRGRGAPISTLTTTELEALVAVVDAARETSERLGDLTRPPFNEYTHLVAEERDRIRAALEPFTPPDVTRAYSHETVRTDGRAWEEVDRWNAEREEKLRACSAQFDKLRSSFDHPERDQTRDQLADAGVAVQRQFRSDQERIAELERERDEWRGMWQEEVQRALDAVEERDALRKDRDEWKGRHKAVTNGLSNHVARADQAEDRLARVPALVEALRLLAARDWDMVDWACGVASEALTEWEKP